MTITLLSPRDRETVSVTTPIQRDFIARRNERQQTDDDPTVIDWLDLYADGRGDHSIPLPYIFAWQSDQSYRTNYILEIATTDDFATPVRRKKTRGCRTSIWNLEAGRTYFWRVRIEGETAPEFFSPTAVFLTEDITPRWISLPGITNVRDCGNWRTAEGRRIRQGLLYRGSEMDRHHAISPVARLAFLEDLRLKTDLDIRGNTEIPPSGYEPPLDSLGIRWLNIPLAPYHSMLIPEQRTYYKTFFEALADPAIYPAYTHCWGGADRTGTACFLLGGLLGMTDDDLILDYELTSLATWGVRKRSLSLFREFLKALDSCAPAATSLAQKSVAYLQSCGISQDTFGKIRAIFLE